MLNAESRAHLVALVEAEQCQQDQPNYDTLLAHNEQIARFYADHPTDWIDMTILELMSVDPRLTKACEQFLVWGNHKCSGCEGKGCIKCAGKGFKIEHACA